MAEAPIIANVSGLFLSSNASREESIISLSISRLGKDLGLAPVAIIMFFALNISSSTFTEVDDFKIAEPLIRKILFFFSK